MAQGSRSGNPAKKAAAKAAKVTSITPGGPLRLTAAAEIQYFEFLLPEGEEIYKMPMMQYLTLDQVNSLETENSIAGVLELFGQDEDTIAAIRGLNGMQLDELMTAWRNASEMGLGE